MTKQSLALPAWIDAEDEKQQAAFRRGYRLGLTGKPQPESGDLFLVVHAGWKAGKEAREAREASRERRRKRGAA